MTTITADVAPDVEVDESELTQQPCDIRVNGVECQHPAVAEVLAVCEADPRPDSASLCEQHLALMVTGSRPFCRDHRLAQIDHIVSRYYTRRAS